MTRKGLPLLVLTALCACSPAYVMRSASGHVGLLWRRRSIAQTIADPGTPPELKAKLELATAAQDFAFRRLALNASRVYKTWTPVEGDALTWLVSASERTRLKEHLFWFPLIGSFPYKGHFRKDLALAEAAELETKGYDATVFGAGAYRTSLIISDPLPQTVLRYADGDLAETVIHELTHGTVYFKNATDFDEALAVWAGTRGAELFLTERFGAGSPQLKEWRDGRAEEDKRDALYAELRDKLKALYDGPVGDAEKLERRKAVFDWARAQAKARGLKPLREPLNNAVVLAHTLYAPDLAPFDALFAAQGRDWARAIAALKALDRRDPEAALKRATAAFAPVAGEDFALDLRYHTADNFLKQDIYAPFGLDRCYVHPDMRAALDKAASALRAEGLRLVFWDCYRPLEVQRAMWKLVPDPRYVADPKTGSNHNRGVAVDVTLEDRAGRRLSMPTPFDDFTEKASPSYRCAEGEQDGCRNRDKLIAIMASAGLKVLPTEWWHFQLPESRLYPVVESLPARPSRR